MAGAGRWVVTALMVGWAAGCAAPRPPGSYRVGGKVYQPLRSAEGFTETGLASWYGPGFHGRKTASGEVYDMYARTAAHKLLPMGTLVRVTALDLGRTVTGRVNDRGPFVEGRVIDLSYALARDLGIAGQGLARVRVEAIEGPGGTPAPGLQLAGPFAWQAGAFTVEANARALARDLEGEFGPTTVDPFDRGDAVFWRVRVGRYAEVAEAGRTLPGLRARGVEPFLVRRD